VSACDPPSSSTPGPGAALKSPKIVVQALQAKAKKAVEKNGLVGVFAVRACPRVLVALSFICILGRRARRSRYRVPGCENCESTIRAGASLLVTSPVTTPATEATHPSDTT
jgi:hypothetical protein